MVIGFSPIDPIKALFWSAVINGVVAVPVMVIMMLMTANKKIMGRFVIGGYLWIVGWLATGVMAIAAVIMCASAFF
jgi:Mn2+/Fe2+ NRAMP family transporter